MSMRDVQSDRDFRNIPINQVGIKNLRYPIRVRDRRDGLSFVEVTLRTGRHHQIRAQFACIGHPIVGDHKYGARSILPDKSLALFAWQLEVAHPTLHTPVRLQAAPPRQWPWNVFAWDDSVSA